MVNLNPTTSTNYEYLMSSARMMAGQFAVQNVVMNRAPSLASGDISVGYLLNPSDPSESLHLDGSRPPNAVRVTVRRDSLQNGALPLFFAPVLGQREASLWLVR